MSATDLPSGVRSAYEAIREAHPDLPPTGAFAAPSGPENGSHGPSGEAPSSLIAALREQHRRIAARRTVVLELPLWQGKLAARYHYLDERALDRLLRLVTAGDPSVAVQANADMLIAGCEEILARRDASEDWVPLVAGETLRYDARLNELLELGAGDSAREVIYALFGGRVEGAMAVGAHAARYIAWLQGEAPEVADTFVGESPASP